MPLRVRQRMIQEMLDGRVIAEELSEWQWLHPTYREVAFHGVLPCGLPTLHLEGDEFHRSRSSIEHGRKNIPAMSQLPQRSRARTPLEPRQGGETRATPIRRFPAATIDLA